LNVCIVLTKVDLCTTSTATATVNTSASNVAEFEEFPQVLRNLLSKLKRLLEFQGKTVEVHTTSAEVMNTNPENRDVVPIFLVSSVTGQGLDSLKAHLFSLDPEDPNHVSCPESSEGGRGEQGVYKTEVRIVGSFDAVSTAGAGAVSGPGLGRAFAASNVSPLSPLSLSVPAPACTATVRSVVDGLVRTDAVLLVVVQKGSLSTGDVMWVGPDNRGVFSLVCIESIRVNNIPVKTCLTNQCATITVTMAGVPLSVPLSSSSSLRLRERSASDSSVDSSSPRSPLPSSSVPHRHEKDCFAARRLRAYSRDSSLKKGFPFHHLRKSPTGLIMLSMEQVHVHTPVAYWEFEASVVILNHPSKVKLHYEPVVHAGNARQSARILDITVLNASSDEKELSNGERGTCRFRFLFRPEYLVLGSQVILREGRIRGVGRIVKLIKK